jgi:hypothetical protein
MGSPALRHPHQTMPGPTGANLLNWDTYQTATPPPAPPPIQVWVNPNDSKNGPAQPKELGGSGAQAYPDSYFLTTNSAGTVPNDGGGGPIAIEIETIA